MPAVAAGEQGAATSLPRPPLPRARRALPVAVAAFAGLALAVVCFHPGYMSNDSIDQLHQARTHVFEAHHPPLMAWVWSKLDPIAPGPIGMLVLQNAIFWTALAIFASVCLPPALAPAAVLLIGLLPPVFSFLAIVWKDVHLGVSLLLGSALLLVADRRGNRWALGASVVPLFYGTAVRPNGLFALLPLAIWMAFLLFGSASRSVRLVAGIAIAAVLYLVASGVQDSLAKSRAVYGVQYTLLYDLAAISVGSGENDLPAYLQAGPRAVTLTRLRELYTPLTPDPVFFGSPPRVAGTADSSEIRALIAAWSHAVLSHPRAYLRHRFEVFERLLGFEDIGYTFHRGIDPNDLGVSLPPSLANRIAMRYLLAASETPFFRAWVYLVVIVMMVGISKRISGADPAILALAASAFSYALPYAVLSPSRDFRYLWWPVLVALVLPLVLVERIRCIRGPRRATVP